MPFQRATLVYANGRSRIVRGEIPVIVRLLRITIYSESGRYWWSEDFHDPTWDVIETAIRRLDRFQYPFVWLFREVDAAEGEAPDFTIIGGEGVFAIDCLADGTAYRYFDPTHGDDEIDVWLSDQGAAFAETFCCFSMSTALQATHFFCDHGLPDPHLIWQPPVS